MFSNERECRHDENGHFHREVICTPVEQADDVRRELELDGCKVIQSDTTIIFTPFPLVVEAITIEYAVQNVEAN